MNCPERGGSIGYSGSISSISGSLDSIEEFDDMDERGTAAGVQVPLFLRFPTTENAT
jgi:hypothetical protein